MTSKISFFKLARDEWKKLTWVTALMGIIFGLLFPFRMLIVMAGESRYLDSIHGMNLSRLSVYYWEQLGFGHWENTIFVIAAGAFCALCAFGYLHSPVKLDFYHSLPIKRRTLFAAKIAGSVFTFIVPYVICQALVLLLSVVYKVTWAAGTAELIASAGFGILQFLASYAGTLLAVMLTGKMLTTVFAMGVLGCYIPLWYLLSAILKEMFLTAWAGGYFSDWDTVLHFSSPWTLALMQDLNCRKNLVDGSWQLVWPKAAAVLQLVLLIAALLAVSLLLYQKRKTERAGCAIAFSWMEGLIKIALVIPSSLFAGLLACEIFEDSVVWAVVFILLFGLLGGMIMEFIYRWDIRQVFANKAQLIFAVAVSFAIFVVFRYDVFGYNTWLPAKEEVAAMALGNRYDYFGDYRVWVPADQESHEWEVDYLETETIDPIYKVAQYGVDVLSDKEQFQKQWEEEGTSFTKAEIKFRLKNGKEVYREYTVPLELLTESISELLEDPGYRERFYPIMRCDPGRIEYVNIYLSEDMQKELAKTEQQAQDSGTGNADSQAADFRDSDSEDLTDSVEEKSEEEEMSEESELEETESAEKTDGESESEETGSAGGTDEESEPEETEPSGETGEEYESDEETKSPGETDEEPDMETGAEYMTDGEYSEAKYAADMELPPPSGIETAEEVNTVSQWYSDSITIEDKEDLRQLVEAYQKDLLSMPYETVARFSGGEGSLDFYIKDRNYNVDYIIDCASYGVNKDFTETMKFLKDWIARESVGVSSLDG